MMRGKSPPSENALDHGPRKSLLYTLGLAFRAKINVSVDGQYFPHFDTLLLFFLQIVKAVKSILNFQ